jgi:hypothetical protein
MALVGTEVSIASSPAKGLDGRVIVGYQGWYGCPGDFKGNKDWQYWFPKDVSSDGFISDVMPSVEKLDKKHLCDTGLPRADGKGTVKVFSSQDPVVVNAHFAMMRTYHIDGAAMQRFVFALSDPAKQARMDHVLLNAKAAAEASGRVFYICYDISGADPATVIADLRKDWKHVVDDLHITKSPAYLHDNGKPVLELWGFGISDRPGDPDEVQNLINDLKSGQGGLRSVTLIGGVPARWRTQGAGTKPDPAWSQIYLSFDVLSPWTVGVFKSGPYGREFKKFLNEVMLPDIEEAHSHHIRYMPVVFPGYSHSNAARFHGHEAEFNGTTRNCGHFLWSQFANISRSPVDSFYVAMFDEVGEGTAIFPLEPRGEKAPAGAKVVGLNQDGCTLPEDWYLKVTGAAADLFHDGKPMPDRLEAIMNWSVALQSQ